MYLGVYMKLKRIINPFKRLELKLDDSVLCINEDMIKDRKNVRELENKLYAL